MRGGNPPVGVAEFKNESAAGWWSGGVGWELSGMLSNELSSSGDFRVVERAKLEKVLEPFEQVENSFTRTRAGTGLGLPLTKAMIEAHGGRLVLESELGKGTTVRAILPPSRVEREPKTNAA